MIKSKWSEKWKWMELADPWAVADLENEVDVVDIHLETKQDILNLVIKLEGC